MSGKQLQSRGFVSSPTAFIRQIKNNLEEGRYERDTSGFTIFKELLQNADDAGGEKVANFVHFGISHGIPQAEHPLLRSPALYVVNDGPFDPKDEKSIRRFGENSKSLDSGKIGKFGLGLKSLFHLCEAFFYFYCVEEDGKPRLQPGFLNPWSSGEETDHHSEWDAWSEDDLKMVDKELHPLFRGKKCFSLWVPLRQHAHLNGKHPIAKHFPGDQLPGWFQEESLPNSLQTVLPLLKHVRTVRGFNGSGTSATESFCVEIPESCERRSEILKMEGDAVHAFTGTVVGRGDDPLAYAVNETLKQDHLLHEFQTSDLWPGDEGLDPTTGAPLQFKEKAEQHGACCISIAKQTNQGRGRLTLGWAVFLPLGTPKTIPLNLPYHVSINIHGYFFTDAGRNGPLGLTEGFFQPKGEADDRSIKARWNYRLAEVASLPLLPETLALALDKPKLTLPEELPEAITYAIAESDLFQQARNAICSKHCWAVTADQNGNTTWKLHSADRRMLLLPGEARSGTIAWAVFPTLVDLSKKFVVSFSKLPRLCHSTFIAEWSIEDVTDLIKAVSPREIVAAPERMRYLTQFLAFLKSQASQSLSSKVVVSLARRLLQAAGMDRLLEAKEDYRDLVRTVPSSARIGIELSEDQAEMLQTLLAEDSSIVFVPKFIEPVDSVCYGRLTTADCVSVLDGLAKTQAIPGNEKQREGVSKIAASILSYAQDKRDTVDSCGDLPIFVAMDCRKRKDSESLVSWNELNRRREEQTLFVSPPQLAYRMQDALLDESLLRITAEVFGLLFPGIDTKPTCSPTQVVNTLSRTDPPKLTSAEQRKSLLDAMLDFQAGRKMDRYRECVRYLLHGNPLEFSSDSDLLSSGVIDSDIWRRIVVRSLASNETPWKLIDAGLTASLSVERRREFSVKEIEAGMAADILATSDPAIFGEINPSESEYAELLHCVKDDVVCKRLPIHQTTDGRFVSIEEDCFWQSEMQIPPELAGAFTTLKASSDPDTHHRQLRLATQLDDVAVLKMALNAPNPDRHWQLILDAVVAVGSIPQYLVSKLANKAWLRMDDGTFISPCDIIHLPKLHDPVRKIVASYPGSFYEPSRISKSIRNHDAYDYLEKHCFADIETSMAIVGDLLKTKSSNVIGPIRESDYDNWIAAVADVPETTLLASTFIHSAAEVYRQDVHALIRELATAPIGKQRILDLLDAFRSLHVRASSARRKETLLTVFILYLTMLLDSEASVACLKGQLLLSRDGVWTDSTQLAFENDGIADRAVVHPSIEVVLSHHSNAHAGLDIETGLENVGIEFDWDAVELELEQTGRRLQTYFRPWENSIPTEPIGGFLALLGDAVNVTALAQQYLGGNRTLEQTRRKFGLEDWRDKHGEIREDGSTMIAKQRIVVEIVSTPTVRVSNIFGTTIEVERNLAPSSIFIGYGKQNLPFPHRVIDGKRVLCFRLNQIDTRRVNPSDLADLLRDSCVKLIQQAYNQYEHQTRFAGVWDELSQSDQLDIFNAQQTIIDDAKFILLQYGLKSDQSLGPILRDWRSAEKLNVERRSGEKVSDQCGRNPEDELTDAKERLRELLVNDRETQRRITTAVRHRIEKHYQYTIASIPFEIFQNADDTCSQLAKHFSDQERIDAAKTFHVFHDEQRIVFAHFGRCVNQYPPDAPALRPKFEDDLWSMLVLNLSSKAADGEATADAKVTGKYGLGFKSCYLVSDCPRVVSGRLGFEVNGAMYPKRLIEGSDGETSTIYQLRDRLGAAKRHSTLIELPMDRAATADVLRRFEQLCGFQVVFARYISSIVFADDQEFSWNPVPMTGVDGVLVGTVGMHDEEQALSRTQALLLRNDFGSLLLKLDADGFACFDDEVPTIWVTAPTDERLGTGFIVNGGFNIDVGRAQLSRDLAENKDIASKLGQRLGEQFTDLFVRSRSEDTWQGLIKELQLSVDVTAYGLFDSLFEVLCNASGAHSQEPGPKLLHDMIWGEDNSAGSVLVSRVRALPTRLDGPYCVLVSGDSVTFELSGILEMQSDLFEAVSGWHLFQSKAPIGSVVSKRKVADHMRRLRPHLLAAASPLRLETVLGWELGDTFYCDPELASRLGKVITRQLVAESDESDEQRDLETLLRNVKFKGRDGKFHLVGKLLCANLFGLSSDFESDPGEEAFRAGFAPLSYLLSEDYENEALVFFDACRGRKGMEAPSRLMAEWVLKARDLARQVAALKYAAHGRLRQPLIQEIKQLGVAGTWLDNLAGSEAFGELEERDRWHLRELLPADEQPPVDWSQFLFAEKPAQRMSFAKALMAVHDWWSAEREKSHQDFGGKTYLAEFEARTFPNGLLTNLEADGISQRRDWMTLFLLGLFHTHGRTRPGQHRGFLRRCEQEGWLDLFSSSHRDPQQWMQFIEKYLDQQVDDAVYLQWMRQFVGIFQLNRHLDDYIECFRAIDRVGKPFSLIQILNSKSSHIFQGGGFDAPPLSRQLGMGACFIVRELVRAGILASPYAHAHCFVPTGRTRNLFATLGCDELEQPNNRWEVSSLIHKFVVDEIGKDKASFCGDFDIPFQFIAEDANLQQQLFRETLEIDDSEEQPSDSDWDAFTP